MKPSYIPSDRGRSEKQDSWSKEAKRQMDGGGPAERCKICERKKRTLGVQVQAGPGLSSKTRQAQYCNGQTGRGRVERGLFLEKEAHASIRGGMWDSWRDERRRRRQVRVESVVSGPAE